jgi:hypothetical protein
LLITDSYVSMVPDHDLPIEIRLFFLHWSNHPSLSSELPFSHNLLIGPPKLLIVVLQRNSAEFGVTIAAIPIVLVLLFFCGVAVQREIKS